MAAGDGIEQCNHSQPASIDGIDANVHGYRDHFWTRRCLLYSQRTGGLDFDIPGHATWRRHCGVFGGDSDLGSGLPVNYTYDWTVDGATLPVLDVTASGTYGLTATSPEGCINSDAITVTFTDGPELQLPDSATGCASAGLMIDATPVDAATGPFNYVWSNGSNAATATFMNPPMRRCRLPMQGMHHHSDHGVGSDAKP